MRRLLGEKDRQKESHNPDHGEKRIYAQLLTLSERTRDELGFQPTVFYRWQKQFFEEGAAAFDKDHTQQLKAAEKRIAALESKLQGKNEVLAELLEEHVRLKKTLGDA